MDDPRTIKAKLRLVAQDEVPEQRLYLAVLLQGIDDVCLSADEYPEPPEDPTRLWKFAVDRWYTRRSIRSDAIRYFMSGTYCDDCEVIGINPGYVARLLRQHTAWGKTVEIPDMRQRIRGVAA